MLVLRKRGSKSVGTKLSASELAEIQRLVDAELYLSISDFVREAVRDKLRAVKVVKTKNVDYEAAKREVLGYYRRYKEAYPHKVAEDLEMDYDLVCTIVDELKRERRLEVVT